VRAGLGIFWGGVSQYILHMRVYTLMSNMITLMSNMAKKIYMKKGTFEFKKRKAKINDRIHNYNIVAWKSQCSTTTAKENRTPTPPYFTPQLLDVPRQPFSSPLLSFSACNIWESFQQIVVPAQKVFSNSSTNEWTRLAFNNEKSRTASSNIRQCRKTNKIPWRKKTSSAPNTHLQKKNHVHRVFI